MCQTVQPAAKRGTKWLKCTENISTRNGRKTQVWLYLQSMMLTIFTKHFQAQVNEKVASLKEEISKLDGMIVQSPDKLKSDMEKMENDITQLKVIKLKKG